MAQTDMRSILAKLTELKRLIEDVKYKRGKTNKDLKLKIFLVYQGLTTNILNIKNSSDLTQKQKQNLDQLFVLLESINQTETSDLDKLQQLVYQAISLVS